MDLKEILLETNRYSEEIKAVFVKEYKKILDEYDLSQKQSLVLSMLDMKQKLTMHEVAELINATPSAASQFIKKLEGNHYVCREVNSANRREVFVTLDRKGLEFFKKMEAIDEKVLLKYFLQLPEEDILTYHSILKKLHKIVTQEESHEEKGD